MTGDAAVRRELLARMRTDVTGPGQVAHEALDTFARTGRLDDGVEALTHLDHTATGIDRLRAELERELHRVAISDARSD